LLINVEASLLKFFWDFAQILTNQKFGGELASPAPSAPIPMQNTIEVQYFV